MEMIWSGKSSCSSVKSFVYCSVICILWDYHVLALRSLRTLFSRLLPTRRTVIIKLAGKYQEQRHSGSGRCSKSPLTFNSLRIWGQICPVRQLLRRVRHCFLSPGKKTIRGIMNVTLCLSLKFKSFQACSY